MPTNMSLRGLFSMICISCKKQNKINLFSFYILFDSLHPCQHFSSYVGMGLPGLNQDYADDKVSCSRTQHSASGEAQTSNPLNLS